MKGNDDEKILWKKVCSDRFGGNHCGVLHFCNCVCGFPYEADELFMSEDIQDGDYVQITAGDEAFMSLQANMTKLSE